MSSNSSYKENPLNVSYTSRDSYNSSCQSKASSNSGRVTRSQAKMIRWKAEQTLRCLLQRLEKIIDRVKQQPNHRLPIKYELMEYIYKETWDTLIKEPIPELTAMLMILQEDRGFADEFIIDNETQSYFMGAIWKIGIVTNIRLKYRERDRLENIRETMPTTTTGTKPDKAPKPNLIPKEVQTQTEFDEWIRRRAKTQASAIPDKPPLPNRKSSHQQIPPPRQQEKTRQNNNQTQESLPQNQQQLTIKIEIDKSGSKPRPPIQQLKTKKQTKHKPKHQDMDHHMSEPRIGRTMNRDDWETYVSQVEDIIHVDFKFSNSKAYDLATKEGGSTYDALIKICDKAKNTVILWEPAAFKGRFLKKDDQYMTIQAAMRVADGYGFRILQLLNKEMNKIFKNLVQNGDLKYRMRIQSNKFLSKVGEDNHGDILVSTRPKGKGRNGNRKQRQHRRPRPNRKFAPKKGGKQRRNYRK